MLSVSWVSGCVQGAPSRCSLRWESRELFLLELDKAEAGSAAIPVLTEKQSLFLALVSVGAEPFPRVPGGAFDGGGSRDEVSTALLQRHTCELLCCKGSGPSLSHLQADGSCPMRVMLLEPCAEPCAVPWLSGHSGGPRAARYLLGTWPLASTSPAQPSELSTSHTAGFGFA